MSEASLPLASREFLPANRDVFVVMFPGAPASGKQIWLGAAEALKRFGKNFYYEESITSATAAKRDKFSTKRYERMAGEIYQKMGDKKELLIVSHSMGGYRGSRIFKGSSERPEISGKIHRSGCHIAD